MAGFCSKNSKLKVFLFAKDQRQISLRTSFAKALYNTLCTPHSLKTCTAGVVWCGMVWYGVVWYGVVWYGMVWYGMVWCGMVWCGVVWCGMVWYGMVWYGMVWYGVVWCGMVWCGMVWCDMVWYSVVWCGMMWCGMVWYGVVWCGMVWYRILRVKQPTNNYHQDIEALWARQNISVCNTASCRVDVAPSPYQFASQEAKEQQI